jgi:hypothetical protein
MDKKLIADVISNFDIKGTFTDAEPYGSGHINDTYAVKVEGASHRFILQRINNNIFKNVPALMDNITRVTKHLRAKLQAAGAEDIDRKTLTVLPTRDGSSFHVDPTGGYWRLYIFIEGARTYDVLNTLDEAYQAAKSFGQFQLLLTDLPEPRLHDTIPDFHHGLKRYANFEKAVAADACGRCESAQDEINFLKNHKWIFEKLCSLVADGKVPLRITHNDTKINNVMLDDNTHEGICVIDLDTVMPGAALYDFGDIVRTTVSPTQEDETDLSKIHVDIPRFEAVAKGYLSTAKNFLNDTEKQCLVLSGMYITQIIGIRFFTDYLEGDTYFKIHRPDHNLDRCRTQFKLVDCLIEKENELQKIVDQILGE